MRNDPKQKHAQCQRQTQRAPFGFITNSLRATTFRSLLTMFTGDEKLSGKWWIFFVDKFSMTQNAICVNLPSNYQLTSNEHCENYLRNFQFDARHKKAVSPLSSQLRICWAWAISEAKCLTGPTMHIQWMLNWSLSWSDPCSWFQIERTTCLHLMCQ